MKPLHWKSDSSKEADRPRLMRMEWNKMKWMRWVWRSGGSKFVAGKTVRNHDKNLPRLHFVHHETHVQWPRRDLGTPTMEGERLITCATKPLIQWCPNSVKERWVEFPISTFSVLQSPSLRLCSGINCIAVTAYWFRLTTAIEYPVYCRHWLQYTTILFWFYASQLLRNSPATKGWW